MAISPQKIASFVTGSVAAIALFAVLYTGHKSTEAVDGGSATLQVASAASRNEDTGGVLGPLEPEFDMGTIGNEKVTEKTLSISNDGPGTLEIKDVRTSCGCTQGYFRDRKKDKIKTTKLKPGDSAVLYISVDPFRVPGFDSRKTLTLFTNDPNNLTASFDVVAKVEPEFEVDPEQLHLGVLDKGEKGEGQAVIRQLNDSKLEITAVRPGARAQDTYTTVLTPRPESEWKTPGKREWNLDVELDTSALRRGLFRDRIYIETNCKRLHTYGYMVNVDVQTFFSVIPEMLHRRDAVEAGTESVTSAVVTADQPISIENMVISDPAILVAVKQGDSPNSAVLDISVAPDATPGVKNAILVFNVVANDGRQASQTLRAIVAVKE